MASKKSKVLAIAFCAAVMSGIYAPNVTYALPADYKGGYYPKDEQHVVYGNGQTTSESGIVINDPNIKHPAVGNHTDQCGENLYDTDMTLGDFNKVVDDLVENDNNIANKVDEVAADVEGLKGQVGQGDTDTHVKEGAATVADNGDVTMDIVDKGGKDTGKDVTISGLASDKELEGVKKELQQQIKSIDVEDTNTQINEGTYTAEADGTVNMDVVDKVTGEVTKDAVTIEGLASDSELATETQNRTDSDTKLQGQINDNATAIATETQKRTEADTKLQANINAEAEAREKADAAHDQAISDLEVENDKQDSAIAGLDVKLQEEADAREKADAAHDQAISDLEVENDKQDSAIAGLDVKLQEEATARQEADNEIKADLAQETNDRIVADKIESTIREQMDDQLQENIEAEAEKREQADNQIKNDLKQETIDRITNDNALNNAINKETVEREAADILIREDLKQETNDRIEKDEQLQQSINNHEKVMGVTDKTGLETAYEGATYIDKNDTMVEADRKLDAAISDVNSRVDGIESRVDGLEGRIDKVGAMSAAIANLRTMGYDPAAPTEVAVGVGQYRDETGMALGLFHYPNRDFMLSLSVSTSGDEYMGGIGATWKFGRKSPEKVAEIKKAQAEADARRAEEQKLAKAEEMKKAAKEAKVQAQMERHAKMLAEQEAQA